MKILLIDNYDSFTYNISQLLSSLDTENSIEVVVIRNDQITVEEVKDQFEQGEYKGIVISPGPGRPDSAGVTQDVIRELGPNGVPILGVCLGHQAIAEVFGGSVVLAPQPMHGKVSAIYHQGKGIFKGLKTGFNATRYHSLIVERATLPFVLELTAWTCDDLIMGLQHRYYPWIQGVQFHPESIMTERAEKELLLTNFLTLCSGSKLLNTPAKIL